jgi:hypothetical protein
VAEGTPEQVARAPGSATGEYLARVLAGKSIVPLSHVTFAEASGRTDRPMAVPVEASAAVRISRKRAASAATR